MLLGKIVGLSLFNSALGQLTIGLDNQFNFCLMIPPNPGDNVGATEHLSVAGCYGLPSSVESYKPLPTGFIQSAHYVSTPNYVQVTGLIDGSAYNMDPNDDGGQLDDAPGGIRPTSNCVGYSHYLQYLGPKPGVFCVRCCKIYSDCDASRDTIGCFAGIPGEYGPGYSSVTSGSAGAVVGSNPSVSITPTKTSTVANTATQSIVLGTPTTVNRQVTTFGPRPTLNTTSSANSLSLFWPILILAL